METKKKADSSPPEDWGSRRPPSGLVKGPALHPHSRSLQNNDCWNRRIPQSIFTVYSIPICYAKTAV